MIIVSIIIPVYNEESSIITLLKSVQKETNIIKSVSFEVIVVDDCSTDKTSVLLRNDETLYNQMILHERQLGKGGAVCSGLENAKGDYILFQDGDLEYNPKDYKYLICPIVEYGADVVIGSRFVAPSLSKIFSFWHKIGNFCITLIFNILNNTTFTDVYSCYLIYRKCLVPLDKIFTTGWEQHGEILSLAVKNGKAHYEVPITYIGRSYEEGKKIRPINVFKIIYTLINTRFFR